MQRVVIIHCHIFKNAGTTLDWVLMRNFGRRFVDHRDDKAMRRGALYLKSYIEKNKELAALSSHHVMLPLPEVPDTTLLPVFLLRHPLERVGSVYSFERQQKADTPGAKYAKKHSFEEYVEWRMKPSVGATIRNHQVRYCSGRRGINDSGRDTLMTAINALESSSLVGVVDRFDESVVAMEYEFQKHFKSFDSAYIRQNSGHWSDADLTTRVQRVERSLGASLMNKVKRENELDLELYTAANRILDDRIRCIDDFQGRLEEHRRRCKELEQGDRGAAGTRV